MNFMIAITWQLLILKSIRILLRISPPTQFRSLVHFYNFSYSLLKFYDRMPIRDLLKKKEKVEHNVPVAEEQPVFTFIRTDTNTQEIISPPTFESDQSSLTNTDGISEKKTSRLFGRSRSASVNSTTSASSRVSEKSKSKPDSPKSKRLSERLHLKRSEPASASVPADLPAINVTREEDDAGVESQWEKRATMLARKNETTISQPTTPMGSMVDLPRSINNMAIHDSPPKEKGVVLTKYVDDNIQEAIRLHEAGELEKSTQMFSRLADPNGENNALSQVLYGLALR